MTVLAESPYNPIKPKGHRRIDLRLVRNSIIVRFEFRASPPGIATEFFAVNDT
jgi:hypothetical protein